MSIPIDALRKNSFNQLPDSPGVYFFLRESDPSTSPQPSPHLRRGSQLSILYIGKATSLRDRVRSYFSQDIVRTRGPKIMVMLERARAVRVRPMDSVLEAVLLESHLIKKYQPPYNTDEKDDKSFLYAVITKEKFPRVLLKRGRDLNEEVSSRLPGRDPGFTAFNLNSTWIPGQARDDKLQNAVQNFPKTSSVALQKPSSKNISYKYIFGPFPSGGSLKEALKIVRRIFPYRDKCVPLESRSHPSVTEYRDSSPQAGEREIRPCFNAQIGLCPGVCVGAVSAEEYAKTIRSIRLFFEGKKSTLVRQLNKEMKMAINTQAFERANELKKTLFALGHIRDVSLLKKEVVGGSFSSDEEKVRMSLNERDTLQTSPQPSPYSRSEGRSTSSFRIEAYDAAHMAGQEVVGVMAVVEGGLVNKAEYRKFHISDGTGNDLASLEQMLRRRLRHSEWRLPDLIVVDGFDLQIGVAQQIIAELGLHIPVVGVVKDDHHRPKDILGDMRMAQKHHDVILLANSEAHRFAIGFHRQTRGKKFLEK